MQSSIEVWNYVTSIQNECLAQIEQLLPNEMGRTK